MRRRMPALPETGRHYVEDTRRARLASPGIERFVPAKSRAPRYLTAAALLVAALLAAMVWLSRGR